MHPKKFAAACTICVLFSVSAARAATAEYILSGSQPYIAVPGFSGIVLLPFVQPLQNVMGDAAGSTASGADLYGLYNQNSTANSTIAVSDAQTGAFLGNIAVNAHLSDIAYTNGQLYGLEAAGNSISVVSVGNAGTVQAVVTQSASTSGIGWRLSGAVGGDSLFAMGVPTFGSPSSAFVIDPAAAQVSAFTFSQPVPAGSFVQDSVINTSGNVLAIAGPGTDVQYSYPQGVYQGKVSGIGQIPAVGPISDQFNYNYDPSKPAYGSIAFDVANYPLGVDGLFRALPSFSIQTVMDLGATPDGTTVTNLAVTAGKQLVAQTQGPSGIVINETPSAPGNFSNRPLTTDNISLATGAGRGIYTVQVVPNALSGDYTYGATTDIGRVVDEQGSLLSFAYDPISSNLVGNGDFALGNAGWEQNSQASIPGRTYSTAILTPSSKGFNLVPQSSSNFGLQQFLQLPTSNSPMLLSLTYQDQFDSPGHDIELMAYLNGTLVGQFDATSAMPTQYQMLINDPSLENLSDAQLQFIASGDGANSIYLNSISLTAVPEPATLGILLVGVAVMRSRRPIHRC